MNNRIGALPYSHHVRARNSEEVDGVWTYSGLWGYEVHNKRNGDVFTKSARLVGSARPLGGLCNE